MLNRTMHWIVALIALLATAPAAPAGSVTEADGTNLRGELTLAGDRIILRADGRDRLVPLERAREVRFVDADRAPAGLLGTYFAEPDFTAVIAYRVDKDFQLVLSGTDPRKSVRWSGFLMVPVSGSYGFHITADETASLWIGEKRLLEIKKTGTQDGKISLKAGERYPLRIDYAKTSRIGRFDLTVRRPGEGRILEVLPAQWVTAGPMPPLEQGGWVEWFKDAQLKAPAAAGALPRPFLTELDVPAGVNPDEFAARFSARLTPDRTDEYIFYVDATDGARLYLDDQVLLERWKPGPYKDQSKPIQLSANKTYALRVEYLHKKGKIRLAVDWSGKQMPRQSLATESLKVPEAAVADLKPLAPPSERDYSEPALDQGAVLRDGSAYGGQVLGMDREALSLKRPDGRTVRIARDRIARVVWQPVPYDAAFAPGQTGVLLTDGDFYQGQVRELTGDAVTVDSLLFGRQRFDARRRAAAAVLADVRPGAAPWTVRAMDGSIFHADAIRIADGRMTFTDAVVGEVALEAGAIYLAQRGER